MGLCSLALAVQGANVLVTDVAAVLPLLQINCDINLKPSEIAGMALRLQEYPSLPLFNVQDKLQGSQAYLTSK